jgi:cytochrome c biogenesis protein CcmG/thiol:disulfide interchange protein DsbE
MPSISGWMREGLRGVFSSPRFWLAAFVLAAAGQASAESEWKAFSTPGGQAPSAFSLADLSGRKVDLAAFKGEVVLVNFWATWCEPCRDEMPALSRLQQQLGGRGFRVLGINVGEGAPRIGQFLKAMPVGFTILRDADSNVMKAWRVRILPASFLIDRKGMLRYQIVGDAHFDEAKVQAPVLELLDQK